MLKITDFFGPTGLTYKLFSKDNKPNQATFLQLFQNILFPGEDNHTSSLVKSGHNRIGYDVDVWGRDDQHGADGLTRTILPHHIPIQRLDLTGITYTDDAGKAVGDVGYAPSVEDQATGLKITWLLETDASSNIYRMRKFELEIDANYLEIDGSNQLTIKADSITTADIQDEQITLAKLEIFDPGKIIIGGVANVELDVGGTAAGIVVGDGANAVAVVQLSSDITMDALGVVTIGAKKVLKTMMEDLTKGNMLIGNNLDRPIILDASTDKGFLIGNGTTSTVCLFTGDITTTNLGVATIGNDKVTTVKILDANVTNAKLSALERGYIKVGSATRTVSDLDARTDKQILIGDGTDLNSVGITGVITITNAGVTSFVNDSIKTAHIADNQISADKILPLANSDDTILNTTPMYYEYLWEHSDLDANSDIQIFSANTPAMEILDIYMIVDTLEGGAMTATLRDAFNGGGNAYSSALDCNSTTLEKTTTLTTHTVVAGGNMYINFSGRAGTATGKLVIVARRTA